MPGITNPAEEYFKDGIWAWVTNQWKKLVATAGGALHVQLAGQEAAVEITQTAAADLTPGICGWDGSAWQKLPLLWGYSDTYGERKYDPDTSAGDKTLVFSTVPPKEIWVIQGATAVSRVTILTRILWYATVGGVLTFLAHRVPTTTFDPCTIEQPVILKEGDELIIEFFGCVLHDYIDASAWGYKMTIAE